jgi:hypothetical protein
VISGSGALSASFIIPAGLPNPIMPSKEEIAMFKQDFVPLLKCCRALSAGFRDPYLDKRNMDLLEAYAAAFSKKYPALKIVMEKGNYGLPKPAILLKEEKDFFNIFFTAEQIIRNITHVRFLFGQKYHTFPVEEFKLRFAEFKQHILHGDVSFEYSFEGAQRSVQLKYRTEYLMIQIVDDDFMFSDEDPEFRICMHYAFGKGYDETSDLSRYYALFIGRAESEPGHFKGETGGRGNR